MENASTVLTCLRIVDIVKLITMVSSNVQIVLENHSLIRLNQPVHVSMLSIYTKQDHQLKEKKLFVLYVTLLLITVTFVKVRS